MGKWGGRKQKATDANQTENGRFLLVRLYYMNRPSDCWITILAAAAVWVRVSTDTWKVLGIVWPGFVTADGPSGAVQQRRS